ncbi:hypothetical protein ES705_33935 [subsurface metagenome]
MKKEITTIELIEKYLEGRISEKEKKGFEELIQADPAFKALFDDISKLIIGVEFSARKELLNKLKETEKGLPTIESGHEPKVIRFRRFKYGIAVAATIAILIGSLYTIIISRNQSDSTTYFKEYYRPYP